MQRSRNQAQGQKKRARGLKKEPRPGPHNGHTHRLSQRPDTTTSTSSHRESFPQIRKKNCAGAPSFYLFIFQPPLPFSLTSEGKPREVVRFSIRGGDGSCGSPAETFLLDSTQLLSLYTASNFSLLKVIGETNTFPFTTECNALFLLLIFLTLLLEHMYWIALREMHGIVCVCVCGGGITLQNFTLRIAFNFFFYTKHIFLHWILSLGGEDRRHYCTSILIS